MNSKVYIIGTGPGDEELLTLKGARVLKECTAVLYDRLVSTNILNYISDECEIYYCGKEPGSHYKTQEEINNMLVTLAKQGHIVGRVKGGDPFVFGRGGEECLTLKENNISFEVIPGVTSPIAVLNYAGIPITQRGIAQSFHVVTGMSAGVLKVNFEALAKENGTLVFMMGLDNLEKIVSSLISNGKEENTPCGVIMKGTTSKQKKVIGKLSNIVEKVKRENLESPCIIVVGEVVNLSEELTWYEKTPLFGKNICITRAKGQCSRLKEKLRQLGAEVTEINAIKIRGTSDNIDKYLKDLGEFKHILFTSQNSVNIFFDYLISKKYDIRNLKGQFHVIGEATKNALMGRGVVPKVTAKEFVGEGLFKEIAPYVKNGEKVLLPCSKLSRDYLERELKNIGAEVTRINIYEVEEGKGNNVSSFDKVDIVLFSSPSAVKNLIKMVGIEKISGKFCVALGPQTYKVLEDNNINGVFCKKHSDEGFLEEIVGIVEEIGL